MGSGRLNISECVCSPDLENTDCEKKVTIKLDKCTDKLAKIDLSVFSSMRKESFSARKDLNDTFDQSALIEDSFCETSMMQSFISKTDETTHSEEESFLEGIVKEESNYSLYATEVQIEKKESVRMSTIELIMDEDEENEVSEVK